MTDSKKFTLEELKEYNGAGDRAAYIVYDGKVIDVSASQRWPHGRHMGAHHAGADLTQELPAAPHGPEKLERFPQVGVLVSAELVKEKLSNFLEQLFRVAPLLRRHPHPMLVHFPIVFLISASGFTLLYFFTGNSSFEFTAWYCLWGGFLFLFPAIVSGLFTWWINYDAQWLQAIKIKMALSPTVMLILLILLLWRAYHPDVLLNWQTLSWLYCALIFSLTPLVSAIGWYGATMSFPLTEA